MSYIDKFLDAIQLEFRNKYKDDLLNGSVCLNFDFKQDYDRILFEIEQAAKKEIQRGRSVHYYLIISYIFFNKYVYFVGADCEFPFEISAVLIPWNILLSI